ncbi:MAG: FHA domain-containing protein [Planctomycetes bacterium]|nr:FHA domain-containing protein [Planctomycetota bacterium]
MMRKAFAGLVIMFAAHSLMAGVALSDVVNKPSAWKDTLISVEGFCERWLTDRGPDVNFFILKDNYGNTLPVRTTQPNPPLGQHMLVQGFVMYDTQRRSYYLDERARDAGAVMGGGISVWLIVVIAVASVVLIGLAVLVLKSLKDAPAAAPAAPAKPGLKVVPAEGPVFDVDKTRKVSGNRIGYDVPIDTTFKVLPGRFKVTKGDDKVSEIKLYQVSPEPVFTFGRKPGPAMRHIRIDDPTVSEKQAELLYKDGKFSITNFSKTNPTIVNSAELADGESKELVDGSKIVMGEVVVEFQALARPGSSDSKPE